ncbi:MAG: hypothetical protein H0T56_16365 [Pseudaminobacter sp.]|nr:hypothetical protein [Pseudaminobacter sp.]
MKIASCAVLASLLVGGCVSTTPPEIMPAFNPVDSAMGIRDTHHHPVVIDYHHRDPVDPSGWRRPASQTSPTNSGEVS